ncbi:MAG: hypothetical protein EBY41_00070 [Proteobacteria bacterium]|jgi:hypothetical protein|nr:hypothetical protein [Pseudomonadota bacterium]
MDTQSLVQAAMAKKPAEFKDKFAQMLAPRLDSALELKKQELAKTVFNKLSDEEPEEDLEAEAEDEDLSDEEIDQMIDDLENEEDEEPDEDTETDQN